MTGLVCTTVLTRLDRYKVNIYEGLLIVPMDIVVIELVEYVRLVGLCLGEVFDGLLQDLEGVGHVEQVVQVVGEVELHRDYFFRLRRH